MSEAIQINGVSKSYGRSRVLDGVSLKVPPGVVFALLGENGAGKSTLIRGLLGYQKFDFGTVRVCGMDPLRNTLEVRRRVGYVSDAPGLYEWMTVAEAGWYASGFYPPGFLDAFDGLTREFELPLDSKISNLSKGMRAKVALSLAMAFDPAVLILDEPTSGLDPLVRRSFLESMIDRAAAGQTVFLSSHQIHEVERVADWVAILHDGKVQIAAPLEELKSSVTMLSYSVRDTLLAAPEGLEQLQVLSRAQTGRTVQLMVRDYNAGVGEALSQEANVIDVKAIRPNLEELYIGFTRPSPAAALEPQPELKINADVA